MGGFQSVHPAYTSEYDIGGGTTYTCFRFASVYVFVGWEYDKVLYACIEDNVSKWEKSLVNTMYIIVHESI